MDLTTKYLGLDLKNPIIAGASPLSNNVDTVKLLEDKGAAAIVMYSLFEEQINHEARELDTFLTQGTESFAEAMSYFPEPDQFHSIGGEDYLNKIAALKKTVDIPIIASLNGVSAGGWMKYAKQMQEAGADALELNIYYIPTDPFLTGVEVEKIYLDDLKTVRSHIDIPVAVKLNPYFSSFANMAVKLDDAGANGLVLFNRFYQPDINLDALEVTPDLQFSTSYELRFPLRWIAILHGKVKASLAATTGIHEADDVLKAVMAGADAVQLASVLLKKGAKQVEVILNDMKKWMQEKEYESIEQMKGSMSYKSVAEPAAYTRANYMKTLQSIK
ncbi:MAG: dihydroorotate dehydrogenase-like protein [Calditrichaceae bacterium]|nr:dihydroorotate dehydrogenase-like protein [Calditrichaceae bacterium]HES59895.1 dihydroorotate dehydrogenase-like protein [Caldithrix sp.]